ncbi:hypothetical protein FB45DRAFT_82299 [Roridomyces roridus]|uniref:Uncharacterized protein n=1 Tax=Roridomyces roridus TaxID=1738132 RepID=A0AAD7BL20_9AGAR|nr:hypothetical protein FB45DRAFT_82299 [Roridomyces roridus]
MSNIGGNPANINSLWTVRACVAAATCYGVGDLINSVECQTGLVTTNRIQASLPQDIYAKFVRNCTTCAITQQNYIDYYYGQLTAINSANLPSSSAVVKAFWAAITAWAATGDTVPYKNFNDWLLFSSAPSTTTTVAEPPVPTYTQINWNPNPVPPSGAKSETFVSGTITKIIAIPTASTTVVIVNATITLAPGGTPVNGVISPGITLPGAVTPTWNPNIIPPKSVPSITFTAPARSWTTVVAVPTSSNSPPSNVTGPPGDNNDDGNDWWLLLFGALIGGLLPKDVGIPGGVTPKAAQPPDWTGGGWVDPDPTSSSDPGNQSQSASKSASKSQSSTSTCPKPTPTYSLSDDSENSDWDFLGSDPDRRRRTDARFKWTREVEYNDTSSNKETRWEADLERRDNRHIAVNTCGIKVTNSRTVSLVAGDYYSIGLKVPIGTGSNLGVTQVNSRPVGNGGGSVAQEHVFELGYIDQFFSAAISAGITCNWIQASVFSATRRDGSNLGTSLLNAIDDTNNMVWVDRPLNQAKSNVVNGNKKSATNPPQKENIDSIKSFVSVNLIQDVEYFARNLAALGTYFGSTAAVFQATALRVQNLLAEVTPISNDAQLPVEFNEWLRNLIADYPLGCTQRAGFTYNYYTARMQAVSQLTNPLTPIPACAPLFSSGLNVHTFTWQNLIPPAPTLPRCDIPGTTGQISLGQNAQGAYIFEIGAFRIMGSGNTVRIVG